MSFHARQFGYSASYRWATAKGIARGSAVITKSDSEYDRGQTKIAFRIHCIGRGECGSSSPHVHGKSCDEKAGYRCSDNWGKCAAGDCERVSSSERRPFWSVRRFSFPAWSTHYKTCSSSTIVNHYGHPGQIQTTSRGQFDHGRNRPLDPPKIEQFGPARRESQSRVPL